MKEFKYPINFVNNKIFKKEIKQITELDDAIATITEQIEILQEELNTISQQANMYINNVIERNCPFDCLKHFIVFYENNEIGIYTNSYVEKFLNENPQIEGDLKEISNIIPRSKKIHKLTQKQYNRALEIIEDIFLVIGLLDICNANFQSSYEELTKCFENLKIKIKNIKLFSPQPEELFDENEHDLIVTKNNKNVWVIAYLKKEHKNKYMNYLKKQNQD